MTFYCNKVKGYWEIDNYYQYDGFNSAYKLFDQITEEYIEVTGVESAICKFTDNHITFIPSTHFEFLYYEDDICIIISTEINNIIKRISTLTVDRISISSVLTFGQVPLGKTLFTEINSVKSPNYLIFNIENSSLSVNTKIYSTDIRLLDTDYFLEYFKYKLNLIEKYNLFYSGGVDSEFLKYCNTSSNFIQFEYVYDEKINFLEKFKSLNHIDVHTLNFPSELNVWNSQYDKVVTGFGGDGVFSFDNLKYCNYDTFLKSGGGPYALDYNQCDLGDVYVIKSFISQQKTIYDMRYKCGISCSENTVAWAWRNTNSIFHNVLCDNTVLETFKYVNKSYNERFLNKYVNTNKNITMLNLNYWDEFVNHTYNKIQTSFVFKKDENIHFGDYITGMKMKYLIELFYSTKKLEFSIDIIG
jgi:hypothetical protein